MDILSIFLSVQIIFSHLLIHYHNRSWHEINNFRGLALSLSVPLKNTHFFFFLHNSESINALVIMKINLNIMCLIAARVITDVVASWMRYTRKNEANEEGRNKCFKIMIKLIDLTKHSQFIKKSVVTLVNCWTIFLFSSCLDDVFAACFNDWENVLPVGGAGDVFGRNFLRLSLVKI